MTPRVLYLMPNAFLGGAERATLNMVAHHDRLRYIPSVLFFEDGPLVKEARSLGVDAWVLGGSLRLRKPLSVWRAIAETRRAISERGFAVVHSCMSYAHLVGGPASLLSGVPSVLYQHGPLGPWMDSVATLLRCDRIVTNSVYTAQAQDARSWRRRPTTIAPPGVDLHRPPESELESMRASVNAAHGLPPDSPVIGMTARFDPWKGIHVALRAAAPLLRERPQLRFIVVGGQYRNFHPEYADRLRALVESEGVVSQVVFAGFQEDVRPYLARMTMLVHASTEPEPFGLTIVEAMAFGVPVVIARAGGAADLVEPGINGLAHTPGHELELRDAMRTLLDDPGLRSRFAVAGVRTVDARFRPSHTMRIIEGVYDDVLGRAQEKPAAMAHVTARHQ